MLKGVNEDLALPLLANRPIIKPNSENAAHLNGKVVLVTGAGGSIGSELVLQIAAASPRKLVLVENSELALYEISLTLENSNLPFEIVSLLCDIRHTASLRSVFTTHPPDIVFHAAALKHVPLLESDHNLIEAVRTNVLGTKRVVDEAFDCGADVVMISTDKAVNPTSGMGLTKRCAEIYLQSLPPRVAGSRVAQVRFGNVLGSSGSVVPLFRRQIAQGGPVTITHPDMTRYLMTIKEAVQLTLAASQLMGGLEFYSSFVLDMGKPVRIMDLAYRLIEQTGLRPEIDIPVEVIGIRPGEKLFEELHYASEELVPSGLERIHRIVQHKHVHVADTMAGLFEAAEHRNAGALKMFLKKLVPEYSGEPVF